MSKIKSKNTNICSGKEQYHFQIPTQAFRETRLPNPAKFNSFFATTFWQGEIGAH